jgi:hypothetical protein
MSARTQRWARISPEGERVKVEDISSYFEYQLRPDCWVTAKADPGRTWKVSNPKYFGPPETVRAANYSNKVIAITQEVIDEGRVLPHKCPACGYDLKAHGFPQTHQSEPDGHACTIVLNTHNA